jgi:uncharacterized protein DUF4184
MPWTFSHPATVLPLRRFCPMYLSFAGLVIGSMIPDLGYYIHFSGLARLAHTFPGRILVCLPTGLMLLAALYIIRKPLWFLLPQPHRAVLQPVIDAPLSLRPTNLLGVAISVVFGAWTDILWDAFTHKNGLVVKHVVFSSKAGIPLRFNGVSNLSSSSISQHSGGYRRTGRRLLFVVASVAALALSSFPNAARAMAIRAFGGCSNDRVDNHPS